MSAKVKALALMLPYAFLVYFVVVLFAIRTAQYLSLYFPPGIEFILGFGLAYWALEFTKWLVSPVCTDIAVWCKKRWGE